MTSILKNFAKLIGRRGFGMKSKNAYLLENVPMFVSEALNLMAMVG